MAGDDDDTISHMTVFTSVFVASTRAPKENVFEFINWDLEGRVTIQIAPTAVAYQLLFNQHARAVNILKKSSQIFDQC